MKYTKYLNDDQVNELEFELVSEDLLVYLTRILKDWCEETNSFPTNMIRMNKLINQSRTISNGKIYKLIVDDWADFMAEESAWHESHFPLILRNLNTIQFIEFIGDILIDEILDITFINHLLLKDGLEYKYIYENYKLKVEINSLKEIEKAVFDIEHVNIRTLMLRMDAAFNSNDYSLVLLSSASIFETMAKYIVGSETIMDQTLGSFFSRYRINSMLPEAVLDYILSIYNRRNITPLAGHGSLTLPEISKEESIILIEMTKAFIRIESRLQREI